MVQLHCTVERPDHRPCAPGKRTLSSSISRSARDTNRSLLPCKWKQRDEQQGGLDARPARERGRADCAGNGAVGAHGWRAAAFLYWWAFAAKLSWTARLRPLTCRYRAWSGMVLGGSELPAPGSVMARQ